MVFLKSIVVEVFNPDCPLRTKKALVMFDDGSTDSYVSTALCQDLGLSMGPPLSLTVGTFSTTRTSTHTACLTKIGLKLESGESKVVEAHAMGFITHPIPFLYTQPNELDYEPLVASFERRQPDILIGSDWYHDFEPQATRTFPCGLTMVKSTLGIMLTGRAQLSPGRKFPYAPTIDVMESRHMLQAIQYLPVQEDPHEDLKQLVEANYAFENLGIEAPVAAKSDEQLHQEFKRDLEYRTQEKRFYTGLPWKEPLPDLPCNYSNCRRKLRWVIRELTKMGKLMAYDTQLKEQVAHEIVERVENPQQHKGVLFYLPHKWVIRPDKPNKIRIIYDGSAQGYAGAPSLNDCLYPGPMLIRDLLGILLKFRFPVIAIVCDIEKAFLNVGILEDQRDCLRFLWVKDPNLPPEGDNIIVLRFTRVAFGLRPSPWLLNGTVVEISERFPSDLWKEILENIYVDNVVLTAETAEEGQQKCSEAIQLFKNASMPLREFDSNEKDCCSQLEASQKDLKEERKMLGIPWNTVCDCLVYRIPPPPPLPNLTKRILLAELAGVYDPPGLIAPVLLKAKIAFQSLWRSQVRWDEPLPKEIVPKLTELLGDWTPGEITIRRRAINQSPKQTTVNYHVCTDASDAAACCCIYVVANGLSSLLMSKTKMKPEAKKGKAMNIHRMELVGVLMGVRALKFLLSQVSNTVSHAPQLYLWTDSSTVLGWLTNPKIKTDAFVENRLKEIREMSNLRVSYINTKQNPADLGTRGVNTQDLQNSSLWWHGPAWLVKSEKEWELSTTIASYLHTEPIAQAADNLEQSFGEGFVPIITLSAQKTNGHLEVINPIDLHRFSRLHKAISTMAYVLRFIKICSKKIVSTEPLKESDLPHA
jgi:hypothetical protein